MHELKFINRLPANLDKEREEDDSDSSRYQNNTSKTKKWYLSSKENLLDKGNTVRLKSLVSAALKEKPELKVFYVAIKNHGDLIKKEL